MQLRVEATLYNAEIYVIMYTHTLCFMLKKTAA